MLISLSFTNFRGFRSFKASLGAVTALLGPNSSGKTTALHAIRFACDALRLAIDSEQPAKLSKEKTPLVIVADGLLVDYAQLLPLSDWRALFTDQEVGEGIGLKVELSFDDADPLQSIEASLICARNDQLKLSVRVRSKEATREVRDLASRSKFVNERLRDYLRKHAPVAVFVPPFYGTVRQEEYRTRAMVDRLLGSGDQSHAVRNLVVGLDSTQLERLNGFLQETIGAKIVSRTAGDHVENVTHLAVTFQDDNGEIELSAAGAGLVNLIALYTSLSRWRHESTDRRVLYLLDEPEAHLHPRLQADMSERLSRLVTDEFGAQLVLATHSVDILNRLSSTGASLVRCDRRATPSAVVLKGDAELFDDLAEWVDLTPYTAINFLAARRVIFCEGDDEIALLPKLGALKFRNNPALDRAFRQWALVRLHGASNTPVAELLRRLVKSDAVRSQARSSVFYVEVVLDRDFARVPGRVEKENRGVKEATTVWPLHSLESLFLEQPVLTTWVLAFLGDKAPADLPKHIASAIHAADTNEALNTAAEEQLLAKLLAADPSDRSSQKTVSAYRAAKKQVRAEPRIWQRGKDRGRLVLGKIRDILPVEQRNQFPTDIIRLVEKCDTDRIGDPARAIPKEASELLDKLVQT